MLREQYPTVISAFVAFHRGNGRLRNYDVTIVPAVLAVTKAHDFDHALSMANDSQYGLQAGVYTRDAGRIRQAFEQLEVGGVVANDLPILRLDHLPYGGVKASGFGREGVSEAMLAMTEPRLLLARE